MAKDLQILGKVCNFADEKSMNADTVMKKCYNFMFVAILFCSVGLLTSCSSNADNPTDEDLFEQELTAVMADARIYDPITQAFAEEAAARFNGRVTNISYKSRESATRKCKHYNYRPYELRDLARTTIEYYKQLAIKYHACFEHIK